MNFRYYEMRLHDKPFSNIKSGTKIIEMRLYDEKRRLIKVGDIIKFINRKTNEILQVEVIKLHIFNSFDDLYKNFDKLLLGYNENQIASPDDMNIYYSKEEQDKYGVVGIEIRLI